ncbi:MAG: CinA family nicotinamide mononucleotide deamidase-related protein, partial [Spirochaetes bacterium]|nr:CinA family nicotinamide mononucleotide deamidase-related protein [Spirochaetota bacterium]
MAEAIIITTGDELLYGTTVDTNSAFICSRLFGTAITVKKHITVPDSIDLIISELTEASANADIIITTGGLGPTDDDNTVEAVSRLFGLGIVIDNTHLEKMKSFLDSMKMPVTVSDSKMASYPESSFILNNSRGLAPGFIIEKNGTTVISMPGVPSEMEEMFTSGVMPYLEKKFRLDKTGQLLFKVTGIRESEINSIIRPILLLYNVRWGITPKSGICDIIVVPESNDFSFAGQISDSIKKALNPYLIPDGINSPEEELLELLRQKQLKLAAAESCTGGLFSKRLTDIPGSSDVFLGSVTAYSNDLKIKLLKVSPGVIAEYGAVSEETARIMADAICTITGADVSVSITGIAGPGGGTPQKPTGTVCFGFNICGEKFAVTRLFAG